MSALSRITLGVSVFGVGVAIAVTGAGVAEAGSVPNVVGQKYSDAQSAITDAGLHPVVSTTVGDQSAWPNCIVSNTVQRTDAPPPNSAGGSTNDVLVSLDCDAVAASAKSPGYSAASPEGQALKAAAAPATGKPKASG